MSLSICIFFIISLLPTIFTLPNPDLATIQSFHPTTTATPPSTISAVPEQSNLATCHLDLPPALFLNIKSSCSTSKNAPPHHRTRCCPVLAAWLYSAYSSVALRPSIHHLLPTSYDMPLIPDDSETCIDDLGEALKRRGMELIKPNETCDVVYCYCGIRLHPLSCPESFSVNQKGKLVGNDKVNNLESNCLSDSNNVNGFPGLGGCSRCLNTLYLLKKKKALNASVIDERATKMHDKDCQLMGLTWLLAKNRTAYIHTVSSVLRAMMMSTDGSDPQSCTLNSDGMPLAVVDSFEFSDHSLSNVDKASLLLSFLSLCLYMIFS